MEASVTPKWFYLKVLSPTAVAGPASGGREEPISFQDTRMPVWIHILFCYNWIKPNIVVNMFSSNHFWPFSPF